MCSSDLYDLKDDLNFHARTGSGRGVEHTLELATGSEEDGTRREKTIFPVSDSELADVRAWLERAGAAWTRQLWDDSPASKSRIVQAVRTAAGESTISEMYLRTGWAEVDGEIGYLHNGGFITARGCSDAATARLASGKAQHVLYPDPASFRPKRENSEAGELDEAQVIVRRALVDVMGTFADSTVWMALQGSVALTLSGAPTRGMLAIHGVNGSGKSLISALARSSSGRYFADSPQFSPDATAITLAAIGTGLHQAPVFLDDILKKGISPEARAKDVQALRGLASRGYDGGGSGRERTTKNLSGTGASWLSEAADASDPGLIVVGEQMVRADEAQSTYERMLIIEVTLGGTLLNQGGSAAETIRRLTLDGTMNDATSLYLQWVAGKAETAGGLDEWLKEVASDRAGVMEKLAKDAPALAKTRHREVPAGPITGWNYWIAFAEELGAITEAEATNFLTDGFARLRAAAIAHAEVYTAATGHGRVLEALRSGLAQETIQLVGDAGGVQDRVKVIGKRGYDIDGEKHVAIMHMAAAAFLEMPSGDLTAALEAVLVRDKNDAPTRNVRVNGSQVRCLIIPEAAWAPDDVTEEDAVSSTTNTGTTTDGGF